MVPEGVFGGKKSKGFALQVGKLWFAITGAGLTVTVNVNDSPVQLPDMGVIV